jgi:hypothetical protein
MTTTTWVIAAVVILILLFVGIKLMKSCLPKIVIGLVVLAALAYVAYRYFTK